MLIDGTRVMYYKIKLWREVVCYFTLKDEQTVLITFAVND